MTTLRAKNLLPGTDYRFRVRAEGSSGVSAWTPILIVRTKVEAAAPVPPSALATANIWATKVDLTWKDNSTNETAFRLEYSSDGKNWKTLGTVAANTTKARVADLMPNTRYYIRICAVNGSLSSAFAPMLTFTTKRP